MFFCARCQGWMEEENGGTFSPYNMLAQWMRMLLKFKQGRSGIVIAVVIALTITFNLISLKVGCFYKKILLEGLYF